MFFARCGAFLALVACLSCVSPTGIDGDPVASADGAVSDDVGAAEVARVRAIVEGAPAFQTEKKKGRVVFIGVELVRAKVAGEGVDGARAELLHRSMHYRYADNTTVFTTVDLESGEIVDTQEVVNSPTRLAPEELAEARDLALADARVKEALGARLARIEVEALPIYASDRRDPLYGRRAVSLLFKDGDHYVANLEVVVDLSRRSVSVTRTSSDGREH